MSDAIPIIATPPAPEPFLTQAKIRCIKYAFDCFYSSNLTELDLDHIDIFFRRTFQKKFFQIYIYNFPQPVKIQAKTNITVHFDKSVKCIIHASDVFMQGSYLRLLVELTELKEDLSLEVDQAISYLLMLYGPASALANPIRGVQDLLTNSFSASGSTVVPTGGDGRTDNSYFVNGKLIRDVDSNALDLKPDASLLMHQSSMTRSIKMRFIFLWMALEAQLGDGVRRRKFFEVDCGSFAISSEIKRLHKLRSDIVHGAAVAAIDKRDSAILAEVMRQSAIEDPAIRRKMVILLEKTLKEN